MYIYIYIYMYIYPRNLWLRGRMRSAGAWPTSPSASSQLPIRCRANMQQLERFAWSLASSRRNCDRASFS